jgi:hypothetical protein
MGSYLKNLSHIFTVQLLQLMTPAQIKVMSNNIHLLLMYIPQNNTGKHNVLISRLIADLNSAGYYTQGYADDLAILTIGKEFNMTMHLMQGALKKVEDWCNVEGLRVNAHGRQL